MFQELPTEPHKVYLELISHYKRFFYNPNYGLAIVHEDTLVNLNPVMTALLKYDHSAAMLGQDIGQHIDGLQHNRLKALTPATDAFIEAQLFWKNQDGTIKPLDTLITRFHVKHADFYLLLVPNTHDHLNELKSISRQFLLMLQTEYRPMMLFDSLNMAASYPLFMNKSSRNYFNLTDQKTFTLDGFVHTKDKAALTSLTQYISKHRSTRSQLSLLDSDRYKHAVSLQNYPIVCEEGTFVMTLLSDELMQYVQEAKTQYNQQTLQNFFNYTKSAMLIVDKNMVVREMNIGFTHQFKYPEDELVGKDVNNFLSQSILNNKIQTAETASSVELADYYGDRHLLKVYDMPIYLEDEFIGKYLLFADANSPMPSELKRLHQQLFNLNPEQVLLLNDAFEVCWSSSAYAASAEFSTDAILKHPMTDLLARESQAPFRDALRHLEDGHADWYGQLWLKSSQNKQKLRSVHISTLNSSLSDRRYYGVTINHIQTDRELEQLMIHFAFRDPWLELPNHVYAERLIDEWLYTFGAHHKHFGLFKLNFVGTERYRHNHDDAEIDLLQTVLFALSESLDHEANITRSKDNGFIVCHSGIKHKKDALYLLHGIKKEISQALHKSGYTDVACSIGFAAFPQDGTTYEALQSALSETQEAYQLGHGDLVRYEQMLLNGPKKEGMIIRYLKEGLHKGEFYIVYQPLIDLKTKKVTGIETLLRWENDTVGTMAPKDFIPLAEKSNFIVKIGYFVIGETVRKLHSLRNKGHELTSSVNISLKQLEVADFSEKIIRIMSDYELPPSAIQFEITESITASSHPNVMSNIAELTNFGMTFNVDDFGTGYSSLKQMKDLKIKGLKIDHSLIQDMADDPSDLSVVTAISAMAKNLGLRLIAEGVETKAQLETLEKIGFEEAQGFLFSVPLVDKDIERFIEETNGKLNIE